MNVLKRTLFEENTNDGEIHVPLMDFQGEHEAMQSGAKDNELRAETKGKKSASQKANRKTAWREKISFYFTILLLVCSGAFPVYGIWRSQQNRGEVNTLAAVTQFTSGVGCGKYNSSTGIYSLTRGGIYFERPAQDDVQFLSGYENACTSCPAVSGATYGLVTPTDCTNIDDGFGNAGIANRRSKNIGCSATTTFIAGMDVGAAIANRFSSHSRSILGRLNAGSSELSRCDSSDFLASAGSDSLHTSSLRDELYRTRNAYFVNTADRVGLCFCHPCGLSPTSSINSAGGESNCNAYKAYAGSTTEMCVYSPTSNWGGNVLA